MDIIYGGTLMKDKTTLEYERRIEANAKKSQKLAEDAKACTAKVRS